MLHNEVACICEVVGKDLCLLPRAELEVDDRSAAETTEQPAPV